MLLLGELLDIHSATSHFVLFCDLISSQRPAQIYLACFGTHTVASVV